MKSLVLI